VDERTGKPIATNGPTDGEIVDLRSARGVQIGDHNTQTNIFGGTVTIATRPAVSWPVRVGPIPLLAGCYQERDEAGPLSDAVAEGGTAVVTQVLSGLGGVGKTQLAAAYARTRTDVDLLVWVTAGRPTRQPLSRERRAGRTLAAGLAAGHDRAVVVDRARRPG
jgi:hypothetical protein